MAMLNNQMVIFDNLLIISGWWCNNHLEKYDFVNGKDDIPYMKWNIRNVWNHQPVDQVSDGFGSL